MTTLACEFVKKWEGCKLQAYQDGGGVWTIGVGHTGPDVSPAILWTQEQADAALERDLKVAELAMLKHVKVKTLTANQVAALTSFVFNLGETQFAKSQLLTKINASDHTGAALEIVKWHNDNNQKVKGLLRRRLEEAALYLK
jgi:lysozyme